MNAPELLGDMPLFMTECDGKFDRLGRTDSWAGLQIFPLQLAYRQGDGGTGCGRSFVIGGVLGFGFGFCSPLVSCLAFARLFLNHTWQM